VNNLAREPNVAWERITGDLNFVAVIGVNLVIFGLEGEFRELLELLPRLELLPLLDPRLPPLRPPPPRPPRAATSATRAIMRIEMKKITPNFMLQDLSNSERTTSHASTK